MFNLTGKTALITGGSGGIGRAIVEAFMNQGARIVLSSTDDDRLAQAAKELEGKVTILPCDLQNREQTSQLFDKAESIVGDISILVNNAGITRDMLAIRMKDQDWDDVLDINLTSSFLLSRAAIKSMMKRRQGRIISIASVVGSAGNPGQSNYCASKAGLIGMSKALSLEVATRGITVNCISPGFIQTAMTSQLTPEQKEAILRQVPQQRMGSGADIAAACVYLASDAAAYTTGQTLHINGGMYLA